MPQTKREFVNSLLEGITDQVNDIRIKLEELTELDDRQLNLVANWLNTLDDRVMEVMSKINTIPKPVKPNDLRCDITGSLCKDQADCTCSTCCVYLVLTKE